MSSTSQNIVSILTAIAITTQYMPLPPLLAVFMVTVTLVSFIFMVSLKPSVLKVTHLNRKSQYPIKFAQGEPALRLRPIFPGKSLANPLMFSSAILMVDRQVPSIKQQTSQASSREEHSQSTASRARHTLPVHSWKCGEKHAYSRERQSKLNAVATPYIQCSYEPHKLTGIYMEGLVLSVIL